MKKKYKLIAIICVAIGIAILAICFLKPHKKGPDIGTAPQVNQEQNGPDDVPYESPIDFESLQKGNPDICGWLEIPGTNINYPVVQSPTDDKFYLNHNDERKGYAGGALFTEHVYNKNDFTDPVTAIYGHRMNDGAMFGDLQKLYTDDFEKYKEIIIYTPSEEIHYEAFAAVAFSNRHILYYYDGFSDEVMMKEFVNDLASVRAIGSHFEDGTTVSSEDQLLVLSTCLLGDRTCRFLVVGKRIN